MKKYNVADRGFIGYDFKDIYGEACSIQESSLATDDALWLGTDINRMHIDRKLAKEIIQKLKYFYKHGCLPKQYQKARRGKGGVMRMGYRPISYGKNIWNLRSRIRYWLFGKWDENICGFWVDRGFRFLGVEFNKRTYLPRKTAQWASKENTCNAAEDNQQSTPKGKGDIK